MGIWDSISSTADSVKNMFWSSYSYSHDAVTKIDNAVRVDAVQQLNHHLQDEEARSKMAHFATNFAKNTAVLACRETLKSVPGGGPVYDLISRSLPDNQKLENHKNQETLKAEVKDYKEKTKELQAELEDYKEKTKELHAIVNRMEKQFTRFRSSSWGQAEMQQESDVESSLENKKTHELKANKIKEDARILQAMVIFP